MLTSPHYPQSNGKLARYHRTLKEQAIRPKTPLSLEDARRLLAQFVQYYNTVRLHSALGYVTPQDRLQGRHLDIYRARDRKLEAARRQRQLRRQAPATSLTYTGPVGKVIASSQTEAGSAGEQPAEA